MPKTTIPIYEAIVAVPPPQADGAREVPMLYPYEIGWWRKGDAHASRDSVVSRRDAEAHLKTLLADPSVLHAELREVPPLKIPGPKMLPGAETWEVWIFHAGSPAEYWSNSSSLRGAQDEAAGLMNEGEPGVCILHLTFPPLEDKP